MTDAPKDLSELRRAVETIEGYKQILPFRKWISVIPQKEVLVLVDGLIGNVEKRVEELDRKHEDVKNLHFGPLIEIAKHSVSARAEELRSVLGAEKK